MRIFFLTGGFGVTSETFIYDRVLSWVRQGHNLQVVTLRRRQPDLFPFDHVIELHRPNFNDRLQEKVARCLGKADVVKYARVYQRQLDVEITRFKPEKIHAEFGNMGAMVTPLCRKHRVPLSVFMHAFDITELPRKDVRWSQAYEIMFDTAEAILTPSEFMRQKVIELGAPERLVRVTHNGIDVSKWKYSDPSRRFDGKTVRFLFVGRLVEKKGPIQLLNAFRKCVSSLPPSLSAHLIVCGAGPLEKQIVETVKALKLEDQVDLMGSCSHEQVRNHMFQAHILVQHSVTTADGDMEGLPVSLTEAAATGLPIISTRHSGIPEVVRHGINGYLVEENDVEGMAKYMCELAQNPELWSRFGQIGCKMIQEEFAP